MMVVGNPDAVLGFSLVGVAGIRATTPEETAQALDQAMATPGTGIVLITEDAAALIPERVDQLRMHSTVPLVVEIPGPGGYDPERETLREIVMRAIGVKI